MLSVQVGKLGKTEVCSVKVLYASTYSQAYSMTRSYIPFGSKASATVFAVNIASMTGTAYVNVSVSSNIMTARDTVVRCASRMMSA